MDFMPILDGFRPWIQPPILAVFSFKITVTVRREQ